MAITEESRNDLHNAAVKAFGREEATTLMEYLPQVHWTDLVTKNDLRLELAALESRIDAKLERELREQMNRFYLANTIMLGIVVAVNGLISLFT